MTFWRNWVFDESMLRRRIFFRERRISQCESSIPVRLFALRRKGPLQIASASHCLFLRRIVIETIIASFFNTHAFPRTYCNFPARSWYTRTDYFSRKESPQIAVHPLPQSSPVLNRRDSVTRERTMMSQYVGCEKDFDLFGSFIGATYDCIIKRDLISLRKTLFMGR